MLLIFAGQNIAVTRAQATQIPAPLTSDDFFPVDMKQAKLGQLLFYDPILSGNRNISCATCHSHDFGTGDGLSLGIGEGGEGVGPKRTAGQGDDRIRKRIPRNASALWNLGAREITTLFHDGRLSFSDVYDNGFDSPAEEWLPSGLKTILAVQALFPMTSQFEMAGNPKENQVAGAAHDRIDNVWPILAKRVRIIPEYGEMFVEAFDDVNEAPEVNITHIARALAAFQNFEWQSYDSPYDAYVAGDKSALNDHEKRGLELFFGEAKCATCHAGKLFSDQKFHALALPHFGPGRTRLFDPYVRDVGHMGESDRLKDAYSFRTPQLRNVELTGPYGHNGAYPTLEGIVRHHLNPTEAWEKWQPEQANLPEVPWLAAVDFVSLQDKRERARLRSKIDIKPVDLQDDEVGALIAFLKSLTGTDSIKGRLGKPTSVPSGLKVD
ncbi:MAG: cytochrome c peroxidase [Rhizobiaceae bacterium]